MLLCPRHRHNKKVTQAPARLNNLPEGCTVLAALGGSSKAHIPVGLTRTACSSGQVQPTSMVHSAFSEALECHTSSDWEHGHEARGLHIVHKWHV